MQYSCSVVFYFKTHNYVLRAPQRPPELSLYCFKVARGERRGVVGAVRRQLLTKTELFTTTVVCTAPEGSYSHNYFYIMTLCFYSKNIWPCTDSNLWPGLQRPDPKHPRLRNFKEKQPFSHEASWLPARI